MPSPFSLTAPATWPPRLLRPALAAWFRLQLTGAEHLATEGAVVFVVNHSSLIDATLLHALLPESVILAVTAPQAVGRDARTIAGPAGARRLAAAVRAGAACAVVGAGRPTVTEWIAPDLLPWVGWLADRSDAAVVPIYVDGLDRSRWGRFEAGYPRRRAPRLRVAVGAPQRLGLDPALTGRARRAQAVLRLGDILEEQHRAAIDRHRSIPEALAATGAAFGNRRPVLSDPTVPGLSFGTLATGADALGRVLARRFAPGDRVGVLLPTAAAVPLVLVALWRANVVPAMMNPTLGPGPALACLRTARATRLVTSRAMVREARLEPLLAALTEAGIEVVALEDLRAAVGRRDKALGFVSARLGAARSGRRLAGRGEARRDDPAVILFTSGTEGSPKGVVLSHGNLLGNVAQILARTDINAADGMFSALPLFHSFGLTGGILVPLIGGATVACYPSPLHYKAIAEQARLHRPTVIFGTDTFLAGWARRADPDDFASVRAAIAGAEPVKPATRATWQERFGVPVFEGYGATETSPVIALNTPAVARHGTAGRLMPGMALRLEDMPGIDGKRLLVHGPNVMQGYLLAERPDVLEPPPDGWYDTGDAVLVDEAGFITIRGRIKRFAKVGGEMVSLAAVEGLAARAWPDALVAAIAVPDARKGNRVILAVAPHDESTDTRPEVLHARAKAEGIAEIMLPARILVLEKLPLLGSGKPDYPALTRLALAETPAASA